MRDASRAFSCKNNLLMIFYVKKLAQYPKDDYLCIVKIIKVMKYTEKEKELIEAIRNYRKAYPNGARELEFYIMDLVYELMENE